MRETYSKNYFEKYAALTLTLFFNIDKNHEEFVFEIENVVKILVINYDNEKKYKVHCINNVHNF